MARISCFLLLVSACVSIASSRTAPFNADPFFQRLFDLTSEDQVQKSEPFVKFKSWEKTKGVYSSGVKMYFHGKFELAEPRRLMDVFDNNAFVTGWVTSTLLEAFKYGGAPPPTSQHIGLALDVLKDYQDKNKPYNTSTMFFWPQSYNQSAQHWSCKPNNLVGSFEMVDGLPWPLIEAFLEVVGFGDIAKDIQSLLAMQDSFLRAFHIPPDFDDTFLNVGLGALLYDLREEYPDSWRQWNTNNNNLSSVFDSLKRYAYRPFSTDKNVNSIDPRTYLHIRGYLDQAKANGQDIMLVPTWIQSIRDMQTEYEKGVGMPFRINNVDVTVAANTIYGMTAVVLSGIVQPSVFDDPAITQIYHNTSALIAYEIKNNFTGRSDLALTYYPSRIEFYWFVARTLNIMETAMLHAPLPVKVMQIVYDLLKETLEGPMTEYILANGQPEGEDKIYFDDFMGDGDLSHDDKPLIRGEDRIFTTAMAVNALLFTWTIHDNTSGQSHWKAETPEKVQETARACANWLREHTLDGNYDPWNAFFSGSSKGFETLPFWYPGNRFEYLNGTVIHNNGTLPDGPFIYAMEGHIPTEQYDAMLKEKHFGMPTPLTFHGYNSDPNSYFPLWSSVPYTYVTTLLAVSRYDNVLG